MIAPEVTDEFNLLENFLHASLLGDDAQLGDALTGTSAPARPIPPSDMLPGFHNNAGAGQNQGAMMAPPAPTDPAAATSRPLAGTGPPAGDSDKARREYYLQAADPSGSDTPEERMQRLLKAKYNAGLLKPFNYIKGYQRLSAYLDRTISTASKQKILRMLNQFRPKFREKAQALTDMELVVVEMWFEKQLMEYDRVFASMAVPACLWRRTGEIFRGNKEMAELIGVPVEKLRDVGSDSSFSWRCSWWWGCADFVQGPPRAPRDTHRGVARALLGGVPDDRVRPGPRHAADGVLAQGPGEQAERAGRELRVFVYDQAR